MSRVLKNRLYAMCLNAKYNMKWVRNLLMLNGYTVKQTEEISRNFGGGKGHVNFFYLEKVKKDNLPIVWIDHHQVEDPNSLFENNEDLSKHIDRIHNSSGLLECDSRKF